VAPILGKRARHESSNVLEMRVKGPQAGGLAIETSANQDSLRMKGRTPLFGVDVWEDAYNLKYQNRRAVVPGGDSCR
jgi:superoxide dismutase